MKKIFLATAIVIALMLSGCSAAWDGTDTAQKDLKIGADFVRVENTENLYYCKATKIVYWIGGSYMLNTLGDNYTTSYMTAYYAENGLPYIYNDETHTIQMIEN